MLIVGLAIEAAALLAFGVVHLVFTWHSMSSDRMDQKLPTPSISSQSKRTLLGTKPGDRVS